LVSSFSLIAWCAEKAVKYKIYIYGTKLAELSDGLFHSCACTSSKYHCVFDHLSDAIMIANLRVFRNVVLTITYTAQVFIQDNSVSEKHYWDWLKGGQNYRR
jgi:hypothetical protein